MRRIYLASKTLACSLALSFCFVSRGTAQETESLSDSVADVFSQNADSYFDGAEIDPVDYQQPGSARPPTTIRRPTRRPVTGQEIAPPSAEDVGDYLASAPRMFGHYYGSSGQLVFRTQGIFGVPPAQSKTTIIDVPMGGGASPLQITDNNTPLPQSRFFFNYNHFNNALLNQLPGSRPIMVPVDQYTMGTEQTFMDGISSWQLQLPITGGFGSGMGPGISSGQIGNLGFISKTAIWRSDYAILSGGMGLELPTGASVNGRSAVSNFQIRNSSTTVLPYLGAMLLPTDSTFVQTFLTATLPASGNQFVVSPRDVPPQTAGYLTPQSRMHLDIMGGAWLYQNPLGEGLTGMALIGEVHYVAAMQHGDSLNFTTANQAGFATFQLGNLANQQTATNLTFGIHTVWNNRFQFRIGGAFPAAQRPNRNFDGEVICQVNYIP